MVNVLVLADYLASKVEAPRMERMLTRRGKDRAEASRDLIREILMRFPELLDEDLEERRRVILSALQLATKKRRVRKGEHD